ncbi:type VII secretion protein EccB [Solwaraspora sp. WMMD1047]|uniref:type VII secretion protein EccB n=1 Tax=Solwaraspora sp. WMMD1047 TaxID=3016102 RepID=UPI002416999D|nr:type VII secretion protein EccB [Solwaraspora sp. WMMD1047]MDG4829506.1 type VII secretion protein EccB [Solwaraspora sp. WMMD1047]
MWTQRDQLQAYQFLRRRIVSALQFGDANHPAAPARRVLVGTAVGLGCALLVTAGFGIYGLFRPGNNDSWREAGRVVIEKESGASYVLGEDGRLHPVLNYASARLLAGAGARTVSVSARSLAGAPRGLPLGIPGAPTSLPARDALLTDAWSVCSSRPAGSAEATPPSTTVTVGAAVAGTDLVPGQAVLVQAGDVSYAITDGRRLRLRGAAVAVALGYDGAAPVPVTESWVNAIPPGPDLALIEVADSGGRGPRLGDRRTTVGQVLVVASTVRDEQRFYLVRPDGLAPITGTEAELILNNKANRAAYPDGPPAAIPVAAADVAGVDVAGPPAATGAAGVGTTGATRAGDGLPVAVPALVALPAGQPALCAVRREATTSVRVSAGPPVAGGGRPVPVARGTRDARTADFVQVPPGAGVLVAERQSATAETGTTYLVTDQGMRFPLGGPDDVAALGYDGEQPVPVAAALLALLPTGTLLDAASARQAVAP